MTMTLDEAITQLRPQPCSKPDVVKAMAEGVMANKLVEMAIDLIEWDVDLYEARGQNLSLRQMLRHLQICTFPENIARFALYTTVEGYKGEGYE